MQGRRSSPSVFAEPLFLTDKTLIPKSVRASELEHIGGAVQSLSLRVADEASIQAIARALPDRPNLRRLGLRFEAPWTGELSEGMAALQSHCAQHAVELWVELALGPESDAFSVLAGRDSALSRFVEFGRHLCAAEFKVRWLVPLVSELVYRIEGLHLLAADEGVDLCCFRTEQELSPDERLFVWDFIHYGLLGSKRASLSGEQIAYYEELRQHFSPGDCGGLAGIRDILEVVRDGIRAHASRLMAGSRPVPIKAGRAMDRVLLIGAYGGEHIGDIAILGGVLCRLHARYGTTQAVLMSQRPAHTRHLVPMLDVPVKLSVEEYDWPQIRGAIDEVDAVVFAGGPLIDLPKQLVRHLYAVSLARRQRKPFIAEGIGPGPFARWPSKWTAARMIRMASRISVRSSDCAGHELVEKLEVEVGPCPSFDYLETRGAAPNRLFESEQADIDSLLEASAGRPVIGLNLRPVGHLFTVGADGEDPAEYTRRIEARFEERLADGLRIYHAMCSGDRKPCFVLFPMNAIQFGMSDLLSAYRIQRLLGHDVDFRVWQRDVSLDGIVTFLRRVDVAITMRFHATIFALSQAAQVIGIDYRIGKRDKVAELLDDLGRGEDVTRIDLLTGEWLADRLGALKRP